MRRIAIALALAGFGIAHSGVAQDRHDDPRDDVVVEGKRPAGKPAVVEQLTKTLPNQQIPRWYHPICIKVDGVAPEWSKYLENSIAKVAEDVQLRAETRPCASAYVIYVYITSRADDYIEKLVRDRPDLYRDTNRYGLASKNEINNLRKSRAVRWFDGNEHELRNAFASRTSEVGRENKTFSVIIVDANRLQSINWRQLGDYIALVALTQPDMAQNFANQNTILGLFDRRDRGQPLPQELTRTDHAALHAFYAFNEKLSATQQRLDMANYLKRARPKTQ